MTYGEAVLEEVLSQLPGATTNTVHLALWNVLDEFCTRSNVWNEDIQLVLAEGIVKYSLPVPNGAALVRVMMAEHRGIPVADMGGGNTVSMRGRIRAQTWDADGALYAPSDTMTGYTIFTPEYVTVTSTPTVEATQYPVLMKLALKPQRGVNGAADNPIDFLPEWLVDRYRIAIIDGTLARMMAQRARPYSDLKLAQYHMQKFRGATNSARADVDLGPIFGGMSRAIPGRFRA